MTLSRSLAAGQSDFFTQGSYLVTADGGETLYPVDSKRKTYSELDSGQLFTVVGGMMDAMFKMDLTLQEIRFGEESVSNDLPAAGFAAAAADLSSRFSMGISRRVQEVIVDEWQDVFEPSLVWAIAGLTAGTPRGPLSLEAGRARRRDIEDVQARRRPTPGR